MDSFANLVLHPADAQLKLDSETVSLKQITHLSELLIGRWFTGSGVVYYHILALSCTRTTVVSTCENTE